MKNQKSLFEKLNRVKKFSTAGAILEKFIEENDTEFEVNYRGVGMFGGHNAIQIIKDGKKLFEKTYEKGALMY